MPITDERMCPKCASTLYMSNDATSGWEKKFYVKCENPDCDYLVENLTAPEALNVLKGVDK